MAGRGRFMGQHRFAGAPDFRAPAHAPGRSIISSNNVLLVIADIILKWVANYIYIPILDKVFVSVYVSTETNTTAAK